MTLRFAFIFLINGILPTRSSLDELPTDDAACSSQDQDGKDALTDMAFLQRQTVIQNIGLAGESAATPESRLAGVPLRMQYWNRWMSSLPSASVVPTSDKYLLFDYDEAGLNNMRLGWEVAGLLAFGTGRTLVLPPPRSFYLIDTAGTTSRMEDFLNMHQLKEGLNILTFEEFAREVGSVPLSAIEENSQGRDFYSDWVQRSLPEVKTVHGGTRTMCDFATYKGDEKFVYAHLVTLSDGRLFICTKWSELGQAKLQNEGARWKPPPAALRMLHGGFVWHPEVFELAAGIAQDLGLFTYAAIHVRHGDFARQYSESVESTGTILDRWFDSALGRRLMGNITKIYISTDESSDEVIMAFRRRGYDAYWSRDYFDTPSSPISGQLRKFTAHRISQLKGPVEQVVCAFGQIFLGTHLSTFTGYIDQMRFNADAPQTSWLHHTDTPTLDVVREVEREVQMWNQRGGGTSWDSPSFDFALQEFMRIFSVY